MVKGQQRLYVCARTLYVHAKLKLFMCVLVDLCRHRPRIVAVSFEIKCRHSKTSTKCGNLPQIQKSIKPMQRSNTQYKLMRVREGSSTHTSLSEPTHSSMGASEGSKYKTETCSYSYEIVNIAVSWHKLHTCMISHIPFMQARCVVCGIKSVKVLSRMKV